MGCYGRVINFLGVWGSGSIRSKLSGGRTPDAHSIKVKSMFRALPGYGLLVALSLVCGVLGCQGKVGETCNAKISSCEGGLTCVPNRPPCGSVASRESCPGVCYAVCEDESQCPEGAVCRENPRVPVKYCVPRAG
jgi:hypothetical protein